VVKQQRDLKGEKRGKITGYLKEKTVTLHKKSQGTPRRHVQMRKLFE